MNFNPSEVMVDFDKALHCSLQQIFTSVTIHGCYFHFVKAIRTWCKNNVPDEWPFIKESLTDVSHSTTSIIEIKSFFIIFHLNFIL